MPLPPPPRSLSFSHVGVFVREIAPMEAFYTGVFGLIVTDRGDLPSGSLVFLSREPTEHHQLVLCTGRPEDARFSTVNQLSFRIGTLPELRAVHELLGACGATDIQPINHGISWSIYARDPEGNRVELFVDTPWYLPQPLREPLDLSLSDDEIAERSAAACVSAPGYKPMVDWQAETAARITARLTA